MRRRDVSNLFSSIVLAGSLHMPVQHTASASGQLERSHFARIEMAQNPETSNPFEGKTLFINPDTQAARALRDGTITDPEQRDALEEIAAQPVAAWFGEWSGNIETAVNQYMSQAEAAGALPVMVLYNIPNRDNGGASAGGVESNAAYLEWIDGVIAGAQGREGVIIFEPDATGFLNEFVGEDRVARENLIREAVSRLRDAGLYVYIEASQWPGPEEMARRLEAVGVELANGVSVNTAGYVPPETVTRFIEELNRYSEAPIYAVVDTSRNGGQVAEGAWLNPEGAALGVNPTTETGHPLIHAYLWIKNPSESDGPDANGAPNAGALYPERAVELLVNRTEQLR